MNRYDVYMNGTTVPIRRGILCTTVTIGNGVYLFIMGGDIVASFGVNEHYILRSD